MTVATGKYVTIVQHTFENRQPGDEARAPFHCTDANAYLGRGFYFWDDNLPLGKYWGGLRYHNHDLAYHVIEGPFECDRNDFFDLVGSREHQKFLIGVRIKLAGKRPNTATWPIGKIIQFVRNASKDPDHEYYKKFDFKAIRAVDVSFSLPKDQIETAMAEVNFAGDSGSYTYLNPCYIICVIDKNALVLGPFTLVHSSQKPAKKKGL
jgi:hypothetical protein